MSKSSQLSFGKNACVLVHGGAGAINRKRMSPAREKQCEEKLRQAVEAGAKIVGAGGHAVDAVIAAVKVLEDSSLFNAGKGSCLTRKGNVEMDASIMDGSNLDAGAVTGITCIKNPVEAARAVMELSPHLLLMGSGANRFCRNVADKAGLKVVDQDYFITSRSKKGLERFLEKEKLAKQAGLTISGLTTGASQTEGAHPEFCDIELNFPYEGKYGTVGAVALDKEGNLAAATSTGGITGKVSGRVGDSPIIGAGTYAKNDTCAVSCTGHGEHFIRAVVGHEISSMIEYAAFDVRTAAEKVVFENLAKTDGSGGVIALDKEGNYSMPFNTAGMFRAVALRNGKTLVGMF